MNSPSTGLRVAALIFAVVGLLHALRLVTQADLIIATAAVPMWLSGVAVVLSGLLSFWLWTLSRLSTTAAGPRNS